MAQSAIVTDIQAVLANYLDITPETFVQSIRQMIDDLGEINENGISMVCVNQREIFLNETRCLELQPEGGVDDVILYFHGGGFVAGSPESHIYLLNSLARHTNRRVIAADYKRAPDANAVEILTELQGVFSAVRSSAKGKVFVIGDSAGGCLALSLGLAQKAKNEDMPDAILTFSAVTDLTLSGKSLVENQKIDPMLQTELLSAVYGLYLGEQLKSDHEIYSPIHGDLCDLPPIFMQVGSNEILLDDTLLFAQRARDAGVKITEEVWPDMFHVWQNFPTRVPEASQAMRKVSKFLDSIT